MLDVIKSAYDAEHGSRRKQFSWEKLVTVVVPMIAKIVDLHNALGLFQKPTQPNNRMTNLQVVTWPVEKLIPYARNARTHSAEQVAQIAASIAEFGWTNPILAGADGIVIAGHARLLAARKLGMTEVPVIVLDHLTETQRRALVLADNRLALNAGWDEEMLRVELQRSRRTDSISTWSASPTDETGDDLLARPGGDQPTG